MYETKLRSLVKSIIWRTVGVLTGITVTYLFIGDVKKSLWIGITGNTVATICYYFHERVWSRIKWGRK